MWLGKWPQNVYHYHLHRVPCFDTLEGGFRPWARAFPAGTVNASSAPVSDMVVVVPGPVEPLLQPCQSLLDS